MYLIQLFHVILLSLKGEIRCLGIVCKCSLSLSLQLVLKNLLDDLKTQNKVTFLCLLLLVLVSKKSIKFFSKLFFFLGWVCYAEKTHGDYILPYISTTKSPQQIMGSLVKDYLAKNNRKRFLLSNDNVC